MAKQMSFRGVLEPIRMGMAWTVVRVPFDPVEVWPVRSKLRVKGTRRAAGLPADPIAVCASLISSRELGYLLMVTAKMRKAAHVVMGSAVDVVLEPDIELLGATPPPELAKQLKSDREVAKWYRGLNYSTRKYICDQVAESKSAETRQRRAEQWMERMMLVMEGEESPPPILQVAFRRYPQAREGWHALSAIQRRNQLFGLFSAQSPEAQSKRVQWTVKEALKKMGVRAPEEDRDSREWLD